MTNTTKTTYTAIMTGNGLAPYGIGEIIDEITASNPYALYERIDDEMESLGYDGVRIDVVDNADGVKMTLADFQAIYPA